MRWPHFILLLFISFSSLAQVTLSNHAQVSIITLGPYQEEVYSAFGHSAVRVYDPVNGLDLAFNYGTFAFDSAFYFNFLRGNLLYKLGISPYAPFRDFYISQNRFVHEQILNFDATQRQKVYGYLHHQAQPEHATYRYNYFYNNCSTKVRDLFVELFGQDLKFDDSYLSTDYTIRDLTGMYLRQQLWGELGIEICLGLPMDKKLSKFEYMFLPDFTETAFDHATVNGLPIVKVKNIVFEPNQDMAETPFMYHPAIVFFLVLVGVGYISVQDWKTQKLTKWIDFILLFVVGCIGLLLTALWLFTAHDAAGKNFNLLWAMPLHFVAALLMLGGERYHTILSMYFKVIWLWTFITLLIWFLLPQKLNVCVFPIVIAIGIRSFLMSRFMGNGYSRGA